VGRAFLDGIRGAALSSHCRLTRRRNSIQAREREIPAVRGLTRASSWGARTAGASFLQASVRTKKGGRRFPCHVAREPRRLAMVGRRRQVGGSKRVLDRPTRRGERGDLHRRPRQVYSDRPPFPCAWRYAPDQGQGTRPAPSRLFPVRRISRSSPPARASRRARPYRRRMREMCMVYRGRCASMCNVVCFYFVFGSPRAET